MMTRERFAFAGFDVRLWQWGNRVDCTPVLYLHGFEQHPGNAPYLARLGLRRQVIAPEHPGYGASTGLEQAKDVIDLGLFYRRLIEERIKSPVDLVGHSLGGLFASELAAIAPQWVRRLVLINPFGLWLDDVPAPDPFTLTPKALTIAKWCDPKHAELETSAFDLHGNAQGKDNAATFRATNLAAATKFLWPLPDRGTRRRLPYISAPTLILQGEADRLVPPSYANAWAKGIQHARLIFIADAGHLPQVEAEAVTCSAIEEFLA